jgi:hypothetical protein
MASGRKAGQKKSRPRIVLGETFGGYLWGIEQKQGQEQELIP